MVIFRSLLYLLPLLAAQDVSATLDSSMKAAGRHYFGTCTDRNTLSDVSYAAIVKSQFGSVTPENSMKWESTEPSRGQWTLSDADYLVNWAQQNRKHIRGHTLVWHSQLPSWVSSITDANTLRTVIVNHINTLVGRYKGKIQHWDVVNEIFNDDGTWRQSVFYKVLGEEFVALAFRTTAAADPSAKLYINDYNLDYSGPKVDATVNIVNKLRSQGVPIHGIGSQAHLILNNGAIPYMAQPLQKLASTGLDIALTELDIRIPMPADTNELQQQRTNYEQSVKACMSIPKCVGVTAWGVSDKYSWVPGVFNGQGAALIWNENFQKKPAYDGAIAGIGGRRGRGRMSRE